MLYRYNLKVGYRGDSVFDGYFSSVNQLVKVSCSFSDECSFHASDLLFDKVLPIYSLISEFKASVNGI